MIRHFFDTAEPFNWQQYSLAYPELLYATKCGMTVQYHYDTMSSPRWKRRTNQLRVTQDIDDVECARCIYGITGFNTLKVKLEVSI